MFPAMHVNILVSVPRLYRAELQPACVDVRLHELSKHEALKC